TAKDKGTSREQKITVSGSTKLSDAEVERMRKDAEEHAAEDAEFQKRVEARNQADQAVFQADNLLKESGDKLGSHKAGVEEALANLKTALGEESSTVEHLKEKTEALHKALEPAVMEMYKLAAEEAKKAGGGAAGEDGNGGDRAWTGNPSEPGKEPID